MTPISTTQCRRAPTREPPPLAPMRTNGPAAGRSPARTQLRDRLGRVISSMPGSGCVAAMGRPFEPCVDIGLRLAAPGRLLVGPTSVQPAAGHAEASPRAPLWRCLLCCPATGVSSRNSVSVGPVAQMHWCDGFAANEKTSSMGRSMTTVATVRNSGRSNSVRGDRHCGGPRCPRGLQQCRGGTATIDYQQMTERHSIRVYFKTALRSRRANRKSGGGEAQADDRADLVAPRAGWRFADPHVRPDFVE